MIQNIQAHSCTLCPHLQWIDKTPLIGNNPLPVSRLGEGLAGQGPCTMQSIEARGNGSGLETRAPEAGK